MCHGRLNYSKRSHQGSHSENRVLVFSHHKVNAGVAENPRVVPTKHDQSIDISRSVVRALIIRKVIITCIYTDDNFKLKECILCLNFCNKSYFIPIKLFH